MHRTIPTIAMIFVLSAVLFAGPNYYINTGISKPFDPEAFRGNWRTGYELGAGVGFMLNEKLEIIPGFHYNNFSLNDANFLADYSGEDDIFSSIIGGTTHIFDIGADLKYLVPTKKCFQSYPLPHWWSRIRISNYF